MITKPTRPAPKTVKLWYEAQHDELRTRTAIVCLSQAQTSAEEYKRHIGQRAGLQASVFGQWPDCEPICCFAVYHFEHSDKPVYIIEVRRNSDPANCYHVVSSYTGNKPESLGMGHDWESC